MNKPYEYATIKIFEQDHYCNEIFEINRSNQKLWSNAEEFARYFQHEFHHDFPPFDTTLNDSRVHIHLIGGGYCSIGACGFRDGYDASNCGFTTGPMSLLEWIWLHPFFRNKGVLSKAWPKLEEQYGKFLILDPVSPMMQGFLDARSIAPERVVRLGRKH